MYKQGCALFAILVMPI